MAGFRLTQSRSQAQSFLNACHNATKDAADRIHSGAAVTGIAFAGLPNVVVFAIGYAHPRGRNVRQMTDVADLKPAFNKVGSLIMRLEK